MDQHRAGFAVITPLRKRRLTGDLYERVPEIEKLIAELSTLPRAQFIARATIKNRTDPDYVPSECLVYFIRASRSDIGEAWFEQIYKILIERVLRSLPKSESPDGKTESLMRENVRDNVIGRLVELLSSDRVEYCEKLDYYEIRFDGALASLRKDMQKPAWRDERRSQSLEYDEESGDVSPEIEKAAADAYDPFAKWEFDAVYRLRLNAAIEALPIEQRRIVYMLKEGFPIDSKESSVMTITKVLGRCEKTVRNYRDKAFAALRIVLADGEER